MSWSWLFTQSNTYIGSALHAPVFILPGWLLYGYARKLRGIAVTKDIWTPLYYVAPFAAALLWYLILCQAVEKDISPGWYMHVLAPAVAVMFGLGLQEITGDKEKRFILRLFLLYSAAFLVMVNWAQASMFAGCAGRSSQGIYAFPSGLCLDRLPQIAANLSVIGWPFLSLLAYICGFACLFAGLYRMNANLPPLPKSRKMRG